VTWGAEGVLSYYNTSFFDAEEAQAPLHMTVPNAKGPTVPLIDSFRLYSSSLIALAAKGATQVHVFEVSSAAVRIDSSDGLPVSFGTLRFVA
jgi:hypothetical protein